MIGHNPHRHLGPALLVILTLAVSMPLRAERIQLKSGGEVTGELVNSDRQADEPYIIRTEQGVVVTLDASNVKRIVVPSQAERQYKKFIKKMPPSADGNWKMAEWCRKNSLSDQHRFHLQEAVRHDPNHENARRALGHQFIDGQWTTREAVMRQRGFVRHGGDWRLAQEVEIEEERERLKQAQSELRRKIKRWYGRIGKRGEAEAIEAIEAIDDPLAAATVAELLNKESRVPVQRLLIETLGRLPSDISSTTLINWALKSNDTETRLLCLDQLRKTGREPATEAFIQGLRSKENAIVIRSAVGLEHMEDPAAIKPLINALVTTHRVRVSGGSSGSINPTFSRGSNGTFGGGLSLGGGPKYADRQYKNRRVLETLMALASNVNFEYDEDRWRQWYIAKNSTEVINLRRGS